MVDRHFESGMDLSLLGFGSQWDAWECKEGCSGKFRITLVVQPKLTQLGFDIFMNAAQSYFGLCLVQYAFVFLDLSDDTNPNAVHYKWSVTKQ